MRNPCPWKYVGSCDCSSDGFISGRQGPTVSAHHGQRGDWGYAGGYRRGIEDVIGLYRDDGQEDGNYDLGFRMQLFPTGSSLSFRAPMESLPARYGVIALI